jgi:ATP-dependent helicase/DNAse subunit B
VSSKTKFTVITGIAGSGKTTALLDVYRAALRQAQEQARPGTTLWLSPSNRSQALVRSRLLDDSLDVALRPNLLTFDQFADEILKFAPQAVVPCSATMQRVLLRRIVAELVRGKQLQHFRRIARTAGFLDLVSSFIAELKRSETWPEHFSEACTKRGNRASDRELALIYERYQQALHSANVYDGEGRFWSARTALADGHWGRFAGLSLAVVDGFTDFTAAQFKILELLAERVDRLYVSLLTEASDERGDLFAKTNAVIKRLELLEFRLQAVDEQAKPAKAGTPASGTPAIPPAIAHIAGHLFRNPRETIRSTAVDGLQVVAVAGRINEVRYLATRVKRLLLDGVAPDDIVVAVRDVDEYSGLIDEFFTAAGLPFACEAGLPASRLAPARALVNLLSLEVEDWPFQRLLAVLDSGYFQPDWPEFDNRRAVRDVSALLRKHGISEGRQIILGTLERLAQPELESAAGPARRAWLLLTRLSQALADLRREHTLAGWSAVIASLLRDINLDHVPLDEQSPVSGRTFGTFLTSVLFDAARAEQVNGVEQQQIPLAEFLNELTDLLDHQRLPPRGSETGCVRVLSAEQVRNLDIPHLFLAGLTETSFPRQRSDDCLYSEGDRQELIKCGLALGHRTLRGQEELLMFYGVVTRARQQLVLTYPLVTDDGQPLSRSPYLSSICDLFEESALPVGLEEQLDPVPKRDRVLSPADCRVFGMAEALAGRPALFRSVCEGQPAARHCLAAVDMNVRRFQTPGLTNFEGVLENPRNIEWIRSRFSPEHEFSATQLEAFATCPFRFLIEHVLQLDAPIVPGVETDYAQRGSLVHELLAELHRTLQAGGAVAGQSPIIPRGEEVAAAFRNLLVSRLKTRAPAGSVHHALERIEQRLLEEWADAYGRQWDDFVATLPRDQERPPLPAQYEAAFGSARAAPVLDQEISAAIPVIKEDDSATGARSTVPPLVFGEAHDSVRVAGRIDRIDVGLIDGKLVFTVIDYKTGRNRKASFDSLETGRVLQLALYAFAVRQLEIVGPDAQPWQMGYWHIRETGFTSAAGMKKPRAGEPLLPIDDATWLERARLLEQQIVRLAAGIRSGSFPVYNIDQQCMSGCPCNTICRVAQLRALPESLGKTPASGGRKPPGSNERR